MPVERRFADAELSCDVPQSTIRLQGLIDAPPLGVGTNGA
jgi:hypothetical protein